MAFKYPFIWFIACLVLLVALRFEEKPHKIRFTVPKDWPKPSYNFKNNPLTQEGFELGRKLFYDPILSLDSSISCASCHLQYTGFTHVDHPVSHGIGGQKGSRNAPVIFNLAWNSSFHWDGGVPLLDLQPINPIEHPKEMGSKLPEVLRRLNTSSSYKALFQRAFGVNQATTAHLMKALSQYMILLVSSNSKYDQVMRKEKNVAFTDQEQRGYALFDTHCSRCHQEPLFTATFFASVGLPIDPILNDAGRFSITHRKEDSMLFKIPTLRNIEYSFPYMHDGRFKKLKDVINYYSDGIDTNAFNLHPLLRRSLHLSEYEKKDLLAFLLTLTDKEFLYNKRFSYPK